MHYVVTFGEAMLRLSPPYFQRIEQANNFLVEVGGAELNVAVALQRLGLKTAWVSKLTDNPLGRIIINRAKGLGVNVDNVIWTKDHRVGLYFLEFGALPRPSSVIYDRKYSAINSIKKGEVDWRKVFRGCSVFHTSGVTPALSNNTKELTIEAIKAAKKAGCKVSFDINYRRNLWSVDEASKCIKELVPYIDILITTKEISNIVLGVKSNNHGEIAKALYDEYGFEVVVLTIREILTVWKNNWTAIAYANDKLYKDRKYELEIVDRLGGGDSFTAGFLYGYLKKDVQTGLYYGNALSALKHSIPGDLNYSTLKEVERLIAGKGSFYIQR